MNLVSIAKNPVPSGARVGQFKGYDGKPMRFALWTATRGERRGTVCVFTGRSEYIEKYFETIADLRRRGLNVAIMDWRGQGGSYRKLQNPRKGHISDFSEYDKDLACFMRDVVLPDCPPPYMALAHSMGGHILARNASVKGSWFERIILSAPMLAFNNDIVGYHQGLAKAFAGAATSLGFGTRYVLEGQDAPGLDGDFDENVLTTDPDRFTRNMALAQAAPQLLLGSPTFSWLSAAYRSIDKLSEPGYAAQVTVPLLMFAAGRDQVVSSRTIEDFGNRLKLGSVVALPQARHEILQETDDVRARFWAAVDAYLGLDANAA